jgi:hypothetical protein
MPINKKEVEWYAPCLIKGKDGLFSYCSERYRFAGC